ncbi:MFS transporter [Pseudomonas capeferrum]
MITAAMIVAMSALLGVLSAFDTPLRQSLLSNFVGDRGDLPNALALNATLYTCSRFVGPLLAGLLLEYTSESVCFSLNALSYLALVATLLRARTEPTARRPQKLRGHHRPYSRILEGDRVGRLRINLLKYGIKGPTQVGATCSRSSRQTLSYCSSAHTH